MLTGKNILIGVSGGIAVYKAVALVSKLSQAGANVKVIMTESATKFVTPLSFQVLSRNDVYLDTFDEKDPSAIAHIDLADWADLIIVAPATANIIGKIANGIADDMLTTTLLASTKEVWIAPAMNVHMYDNPSVKRNIERLYSDGFRFIEPSEGFLACGYVGKGRLEEPENIVHLAAEHFSLKSQPLKGKKVVVTAGPTREKIDPVRYITNFSSGKMGYAMAEAAASLGAETILISGPVDLTVPQGVKAVFVESAEEMLQAVLSYFEEADIMIKTAAVADYKPKMFHSNKMKKKSDEMTIELTKTTDILQTIGSMKKHQLLIGFAAETDDVVAYAKDKLVRKNADYIVANDVTKAKAGFGTDTNIVILIGNDFQKEFPVLPKKELGREILLTIDKREKGDRNDR